jgi:Late exocytosis, associated with Golgi transport
VPQTHVSTGGPDRAARHSHHRRTAHDTPPARRFRPPRLPLKLLTWMVPVFTMKDERFAACAGFDALSYVRALKLMMLMCLYVTITCMLLVLPVNLTSSYVDSQTPHLTAAQVEACASKGTSASGDQAVVRRPLQPCLRDARLLQWHAWQFSASRDRCGAFASGGAQRCTAPGRLQAHVYTRSAPSCQRRPLPRCSPARRRARQAARRRARTRARKSQSHRSTRRRS